MWQSGTGTGSTKDFVGACRLSVGAKARTEPAYLWRQMSSLVRAFCLLAAEPIIAAVCSAPFPAMPRSLPNSVTSTTRKHT